VAIGAMEELGNHVGKRFGVHIKITMNENFEAGMESK
jgi:hypothetical protein